MDAMKKIYLLLICQGFYLGSVCQRWTFPEKITALIGSCVEIPCVYDPAGSSGAASAVWYLYTYRVNDPEILNTKEQSSVIEEYKDRTSLVPGNNSCTLRIDPVGEGDKDKYYYPGIAEAKNTNAYKINSRSIYVDITDKGSFELHILTLMTEGEATTIRCVADHTCRSSPPSLLWNKPGQAQNQSVEISGGFWSEVSNLTYIPSYVDDGAIIRCTALYPNGLSAQITRTLNINYAPKNVTVNVILNNEIMEGSDVTLQCNSFSKPDVYEYVWYKGKEKAELPESRREITVRNVTRDTEPYSCAVINDVGRGESSLMEIPVLYAATGVHITVKSESDFIKLICDFLSSRPDVTHYTWMRDGSILQDETGKNLTIDNNDESNGRYSCIAHNSAGNSSSEGVYQKGSRNITVVVAIIGTIFLVLLVSLVCAYWRKRLQQPETSEAESPYTDLRISDITEIYHQLKAESPYTDLRISDITEIYHQLKPVVPAEPTVVGSAVVSVHEYENVL